MLDNLQLWCISKMFSVLLSNKIAFSVSKTYDFYILVTEDEIVTEKLAKDLEKAQLNTFEVQRLTEILLNKQNELTQWQKVSTKNPE